MHCSRFGFLLVSLAACHGRTELVVPAHGPAGEAPRAPCTVPKDRLPPDLGVLWSEIAQAKGVAAATDGRCAPPDEAFSERWLGRVTAPDHVQTMIACLRSGSERSSCAARLDRIGADDRRPVAAPIDDGVHDFADAKVRSTSDGCQHWQFRRLTMSTLERRVRWEAALVAGSRCPEDTRGDAEPTPALRCSQTGVAPLVAGRGAGAARLGARAGGVRGAIPLSPATLWACGGVAVEMPPRWAPPLALSALCRRLGERSERSAPPAAEAAGACDFAVPFSGLGRGARLQATRAGLVADIQGERVPLTRR